MIRSSAAEGVACMAMNGRVEKKDVAIQELRTQLAAEAAGLRAAQAAEKAAELAVRQELLQVTWPRT